MRTKRGSRRSRRQREARRRRWMRRFCVAVVVILLGVAAMSPELRARVVGVFRRGVQTVTAFAQRETAQTEVILPERKVYMLQLGAFNNGELAQNELQQLWAAGVPCIIWQREQMRILCDAAFEAELLSQAAAQGREAFVIEGTLGEVVLRVEADSGQIGDVQTLICLPDALLDALGDESLPELLQKTREQAQTAKAEHPNHLLYTQLAQSLLNWCDLLEGVMQNQGESIARNYARATMCVLCFELRKALLDEGIQSEASTASAQRTPSTAADVMPPA